MMKLSWSTLHVRDMDESIAFYRDIVGLALQRRIKAGPDMELAFLGEGETKIELIDRKDQTSIEVGPDISWGFEVDSLDDMMQFLQARGVKIVGGPIQPSPHMRFIYAADPNGLKIQFYENLAAKHKPD